MSDFITEVTYFRFGAKISSEPPCESDIRAGAMTLSYKLKDEDEVSLDGGPTVDPPLPPAPEPAIDPDLNPVLLLYGEGWRPRATKDDYVAPPNDQQPAAFGRAGIFERLKLTFVFPAFCLCRVTNGECRVARFQLAVNYDGSSHPDSKLTMSRISDDCPSFMTLNPTELTIAATKTLTARVPLTDSLPDLQNVPEFFQAGDHLEAAYANRDAIGLSQIECSWEVPLPCVGPPDEGSEIPLKRNCTVRVSSVYNYRTRERQ